MDERIKNQNNIINDKIKNKEARDASRHRQVG